MYVIQSLRGKPVTFRKCEPEDLVPHFETVAGFIEPEQQEAYIRKMNQCIEAGTAYVTTGGECFLYYEVTKKAFADAVTIYGEGHPVKMMAMLAGIFKFCDRETRFIYLRLHRGKSIQEYKGLVTEKSIYKHKNNGDKLLIRTDHLLSKFEKLRIRGEKN